MANLLAQEPIYISIEDFDDTATDADVLALTDDEKKALIWNAQVIIDDYINAYGIPYDEDQDFIFPIDVDGVSTVPTDISIATVYVSEEYFTKQSASTTDGLVKTIKSGPRTTEYFSPGEYGGNPELFIDARAQKILDRYRNDFIYQTL